MIYNIFDTGVIDTFCEIEIYIYLHWYSLLWDYQHTSVR